MVHFNLLAKIFNGIWQIAENLVFFSVHSFTFCMDPSSALTTLHHSRLVVVIIVATLTERTVGTLLFLEAASGAERRSVEVVLDVGFAAGIAF